MFGSISITTNRREVSKSLVSSSGILRAPWKTIMRHLGRRAGAARLRELDGDELRDIGLVARSEIRAAAFGLITVSNDRTRRD